jgi:hypothetical protein
VAFSRALKSLSASSEIFILNGSRVLFGAFIVRFPLLILSMGVISGSRSEPVVPAARERSDRRLFEHAEIGCHRLSRPRRNDLIIDPLTDAAEFHEELADEPGFLTAFEHMALAGHHQRRERQDIPGLDRESARVEVAGLRQRNLDVLHTFDVWRFHALAQSEAALRIEVRQDGVEVAALPRRAHRLHHPDIDHIHGRHVCRIQRPVMDLAKPGGKGCHGFGLPDRPIRPLANQAVLHVEDAGVPVVPGGKIVGERLAVAGDDDGIKRVDIVIVHLGHGNRYRGHPRCSRRPRPEGASLDQAGDLGSFRALPENGVWREHAVATVHVGVAAPCARHRLDSADILPIRIAQRGGGRPTIGEGGSGQRGADTEKGTSMDSFGHNPILLFGVVALEAE